MIKRRDTDLSIYLIVRTNIEKNYTALKFCIDNSYFSSYRECTLTRKTASKRMVIDRTTSFSRHEQYQSFLKLICEPTVRTDPLPKMFLKRSVTLNEFHFRGLS